MNSINNNKHIINSFKFFRDKLKYIKYYKYININKSDNCNIIPNKYVRRYNFARFNGPQKFLCFAPYNNLFFDIRGKVVVCNQNREYILGDISQESLHDIWFGKKRKQLCENIENHDFSLGCQKCADAIISENYNSLMAISYDYTTKISHYPTRLEFELSNICNLACVMCNGFLSSTYQKHFHQKEPYKNVYSNKFIEQLEEFIPHLTFTKFSGGEPFLIDMYYDIWELIIKLNPKCGIHVQTNGLILNNKVKKILEKGNFHIGVSLDGTSKESFENIRLYGKFDRVLNNLYYFRDYCERKNTKLNIPFTPTIKSMYEVPYFSELANRYNATVFFNVVWEPHALAIWTLDSATLKELLQYYKKFNIQAKNYTEHKNKLQFEFFKNQIIKWISDAEIRETMYKNYEEFDNEKLISTLIEKLIVYDNGTLRNWFTDEIIENPQNYYYSILNQKLKENPQKIRGHLIKMNTYDIERVYIDVNNFFHLH